MLVIKNILSNSAEGNQLIMEFILFNLLKDLPEEVIEDITQELNLHSDDKEFVFDFDLKYPNLYSKYSISFMTRSDNSTISDYDKKSFIVAIDRTADIKYEFEYSKCWSPISVISAINKHNRLKDRKLCELDYEISDELYKIALNDTKALDLLVAIKEKVETEVHFSNGRSLSLIDEELSLFDKDNNVILSEVIRDNPDESDITLDDIFNPWLDILIDKRDLS